MLAAGLQGKVSHRVTEEDTAARHGSGLVAVFSTPALVALMESAAVAALQGHLAEGQTTVGARIDVQHLAATPIGLSVHAQAILETVEGRKLVFRLEAWDDVEKIGQAYHERYIIDEKRFMEKIKRKTHSAQRKE